MAPSQFLCNGLDPAASANQGLRDRRTGCRPGRTRSIRMATPRSRWKRGTSGLGCWKTLAAHPEPSADVTRAGTGSPPFSRTLTRRPIEAMRSVHVEAKEVQRGVQAPHLPNSGRRRLRRVRLHRDVLQPGSTAWFRWRRLTGRV